VTILGLHLAAPDRALIWCDTETFTRGVPAGHACKLAVNALIPAIAVGAGGSQMIKAARTIFERAPSLGEALDRIPAALKSSAREPGNEDFAPHCVYVLAALHPQYGRLVAFIFEAPDFSARSISSIAIPEDDDLVSMHPADLADIVPTAQLQLEELRRTHPAATGGTLLGAVLTPRGATTCRLTNLAEAYTNEGKDRWEAAASCRQGAPCADEIETPCARPGERIPNDGANRAHADCARADEAQWR
jgi:hypothetical protein